MSICFICEKNDQVCAHSDNQEYGRALAGALIAHSTTLPVFVEYIRDLAGISIKAQYKSNPEFNDDHTFIAIQMIKCNLWGDMIELVKDSASLYRESSILDLTLSVDENLAKIAKRKLILDQIKSKLIFDRIRSCSHEIIYSGSGDAHPHGDDECLCRNCGLAIPAGIGGLINKKILSFHHSYLMVSKDFSSLPKLFKLSKVQSYALKFPKRFEINFLNELFKETPYAPEDVLMLDDGNYTFYEDSKYSNYKEWHNDIYQH